MMGSPRQLENAVPTSRNPHGVWVWSDDFRIFNEEGLILNEINWTVNSSFTKSVARISMNYFSQKTYPMLPSSSSR